ncbi:MAG: helix-turn-helix domain-containing protein [Flavobacteriaceae bacterium]|nr:helix-turn-helix domain-containing protein [Flavobacteriaceae bacterium]
MPFNELCKEYNISRKTGYKWRKRFLDEGYDGMYDRSRRPKSSPGSLMSNVYSAVRSPNDRTTSGL